MTDVDSALDELVDALGLEPSDDIARVLREAAVMARKLARDARTDALTGLPNRRALVEELDRACAHSVRSGRPLSVLFIDLVGFKGVNDRYGHKVGDLVLRNAAAVLRSRLRAGDYLARLAGDEFVAILNDADAATAREHVDERFGAPIEGIASLEGSLPTVEVAIGVEAGCSETAEEMLAAADARMYEGRRS